jgi:pyruvate dehydrogenase (quinone)
MMPRLMAHPVVALTGLTFHDLRGVRYQQSVDTVKLMEPLTIYNEEVTGPEQAVTRAKRWLQHSVRGAVRPMVPNAQMAPPLVFVWK